jgi:hypothetical protein
LSPWPALAAYLTRMRQRPAILRALAEELELYRLEAAQPAKAEYDSNS